MVCWNLELLGEEMKCPHCGEKIENADVVNVPPDVAYIRVSRKKIGFKTNAFYDWKFVRFFESMQYVWTSLSEAIKDFNTRKGDFFYECRRLSDEEIKAMSKSK